MTNPRPWQSRANGGGFSRPRVGARAHVRPISTLLLALGAAAAMIVLDSIAGRAAPANCSLTSPAFCETFDQGPSAQPGRGGDLNPVRWSTGRLAPSDVSGAGPVANPVAAGTMGTCRSPYSGAQVYPPYDTLICDPSGARTSQLMTAVAIQNYGNNSYMIRQPFDFAGRTGKITFDVDAVTESTLATYIEIDITDEPVPAPTFREAENFETGPVPRNGLSMKLSDNCNTQGTAVKFGLTLVYTNYQATTITPASSTTNCPTTRAGSLNHFEIRLSQTRVDVFASDFSTDEGQTYPNFRNIYSANLNLAFTRGYVHISARNHATKKYGFGWGRVYRWDNIGFDGPVLATSRGYEIPDNTKMGTNPAEGNTTVMNLGYVLLDGTTGKTAGIYDPVTRLNSLQFSNVDIGGATAAQLSMTAAFNTIGHTATTQWGVSYRLNGITWRNRTLNATEVQAINTAGTAGNFMMTIDVPVSDVRAGTNTLELVPIGGSPMDRPPVVANIDLVVAVGGSVPAAPTGVRVVP